MARDAYQGFAERYDLFFGEPGEQDARAVSFFRRLFLDNNVHSVLDCACGTGRDLLLFQSLGCAVMGSDVSQAMLDQARRNLSGAGIRIPMLKADYRALPSRVHQTFDAVMCLSTAIGEMPDEMEVSSAFRSMHAVLRDGGILVLTQGTTDKQWSERPRFLPMVNTRDFSRVCVIDYLAKGARYHILDVFHSETRSDFKVWSVDYLRVLLRDDFDRLLKSSGFKSADFYGDYDFEPYDKQSSNRLIVVAHK